MSVEQPRGGSTGTASNVEERSQPGPADSETHRPTVLLIDEPVRADLFEMWLADTCTVRTAATPAAVRQNFDDSVMVALVRNEVGDEAKALVEEQIRLHSPFCRTVITTTEHVEILFPEISYDVCLHEPTNRGEVRETVDRLSRRATYQSLLKKYYRLTVSLANREISDTAAELPEDPEYDSLREAKDRLLAALTRLQSTFDDDDLRAVQDSLRPQRAFGPDATERNEKAGKKHLPDRCVGCGREWSTNGNSPEASGYRRLGAFVWKCRDCGTVQKLSDPSHRRVAR